MGNVADIVVPLPPALQTEATGATTTGQAYSLAVPSSATDALTVTAPDGSWVSWQPTELVYRDEHGNWDYLVGSAPSALTVQGRTVSYDRVFPDSRDVFVAEAERVKHYLILNERPRAPIELLTGQVWLGVAGLIGGIPLSPGRHTALESLGFRFEEPVGWDTTQTTTDGDYEVLDTNEGQMLIMYFPAEWVLSEDRVYPVTLDPTVQTSAALNAVTGFDNRQIVRLSDDTLAVILRTGTATVNLYYSSDLGQTWLVPTSGATYSLTSSTTVLHIIVAPNDGIYLTEGYGTIREYLITPNGDRSQYTWTSLGTVSTGSDGYVPVSVMNVEGTGTIEHVVFSSTTTNNRAYYRPVSYTSAGVRTLGTLVTLGGGYSGGATTNPTIGQDASKNLVVCWTTGNTGVGKGIVAKWGGYSSGTVAWGTAESVDTSNYAASGLLSGAMDDQGRMVLAYRKSTDNNVKVLRRGTGSSGTWAELTGIPSIAPDKLQVVCHGSDIYVWVVTSTGLQYVKWDADSATWGTVQTIIADATAVGLATLPDATGGYMVAMTCINSGTLTVVSETITFNQPPTAPSGLTRANFDANQTVTFTWQANDSDPGDTSSAYDLEIRVNGAGVNTVATGWVSSPLSLYQLVSNTLTNPGTWQWRVRTKDQAGAESPWSEYATVQTGAAPVPTITYPTVGATVASAEVTFQWSASDQSSAIVRRYDAAGTTLLDTQNVTQASARLRTLTGMSNVTDYQGSVQVTSAIGVQGPEVFSGAFSVSYMPPYAPKLLTAVGDAAVAAVKLRWERGYSLLATFARASVAYLSDGTEVGTNQPRYDTVGGASGIWVEESASNIISAGASTCTSDWFASGETAKFSLTLGADAEEKMRLITTSAFTTYGDAKLNLTPATVQGRTYTVSGVVEVSGLTTGSVKLRVEDFEGSTYSGNEYTITADGQYQVIATRAFRASLLNASIVFRLNTVNAGVTVTVRRVIMAEKPYTTTWTLGGTTRAVETLQLPTTGLSPTLGAWRQWVHVNSNAKRQVAGQFPRIFEIPRASGAVGVTVMHDAASANWILQTRDDANELTNVNVADSYTPDGMHLLEVAWDAVGQVAVLRIDGVTRGTINSPRLPTGFASAATIGSSGGSNYANTVHGQAQRRSDYPTDIESLIAFNLGVNGLTWDTNTVALYSWDNSLEGGSQNSVFADQWEVHRGGTRIAVVANPDSGDVAYDDYAAGSGVSYDYTVRAVGSNGTYSADTAVTGTWTATHGVWLHDALSPADTIHLYEYREVQAQDEPEVPSGEFRFAGRSAPVVQFDGSMMTRNVRIRVAVPNDTTDQASLEALLARRSTVCLRDFRGRKVYGALRKLPITDEKWGGWVDVEIAQVPFEEGI